MEIYIKQFFKLNTPGILRKCSYFPIYDRRSKKSSFVRRLGTGRYPRFHVYIVEERAGYIHLNLHLDMKKETYGEMTAHSGEYEGKEVEQEKWRILSIFKTYLRNSESRNEDKDTRKGFFGKLFG